MAAEKIKCDVMSDDVKQENTNANNMPSGGKNSGSCGGAQLPNLNEQNCENREICISLLKVLKSFNSAISEEQAWAVLYQFAKLYKERISAQPSGGSRFKDIYVPTELSNINLHKDGSVHINLDKIGEWNFFFNF